MLPLRQQVGCFRGWSWRWTHLGVEREAERGWAWERSWQILHETHASKLRCFSRHIPVLPDDDKVPGPSLGPSWGIPLLGRRASLLRLGLLGLGLALEAGTGLSSPRTQFGEGLEGVVAKTFELLALGPEPGQASESLSLPDPPKSDSKLGLWCLLFGALGAYPVSGRLGRDRYPRVAQRASSLHAKICGGRCPVGLGFVLQT